MLRLTTNLKTAIIAFACISLILSPLHLMQIKLTSPGEWEYHEFTSICHKTLQIPDKSWGVGISRVYINLS